MLTNVILIIESGPSISQKRATRGSFFQPNAVRHRNQPASNIEAEFREKTIKFLLENNLSLRVPNSNSFKELISLLKP